MIVKVGGWLYIISGFLSLCSAFTNGGALGSGSVFPGLVLAAFNGAIGFGLLKHANWARWLALGVSLLTWTLGSIGMLLMLAYGLKFMFAGAGGMAGVLALVVIFVGGIFAVIIVINFKLFHYLITEEAKDEFDTPEIESRPVLKSTGFYIAMVIVLAGLESLGGRPSLDRAMMQRAMGETAADAARARELDSTRREAESLASSLERERRLARDREEANRQKLQELSRVASDAEAKLERERREAAMNDFRSGQQHLAEQRRTDFENRMRDPDRPGQPSRDYEAESRRLQEKLEQGMRSSTGASQSATSGNSASTSNSKILKCRDASGSVQFTQGYCPSGTTLVESPPSE